jgi:hypothetical protein
MIVGTILTLYGVWSILVDGILSKDLGWWAISVLFPAVTAVLGFLMYRVEPWYPPGVDPKGDDDS